MISDPPIRALACLILLSMCLLGCNRRPTPPSITGLPNIDKAELFKLKKHGDLWNGEMEKETTLIGNEAEDVARLWRAQSFSSDSPICHNPGYAIKFYDRDVQIVYATLCWECDNIEFLTPKLGKYVGFDAQGAKGQELLKYLKDRLGSKSPIVSMRRTLDAVERAQRSANEPVRSARPADRIVRALIADKVVLAVDRRIIHGPNAWPARSRMGLALDTHGFTLRIADCSSCLWLAQSVWQDPELLIRRIEERWRPAQP